MRVHQAPVKVAVVQVAQALKALPVRSLVAALKVLALALALNLVVAPEVLVQVKALAHRLCLLTHRYHSNAKHY